MAIKTIKQKFVLDESGSMLAQQQVIINGFNEQLATMRQEEKAGDIRYLVTLTKFSDNATMIYKDVPLEQVADLTEQTYTPKGWTALYDAIGMTIDTATQGETDVLVTILTDGFENKSREWKKAAIKTLIDIRQRENKWGFVYFGANQDAWTEASNLGVLNAVNYTMANTGQAISAMSAVRSCYTSSVTSGNYNSLDKLTSNVNQDELTK